MARRRPLEPTIRQQARLFKALASEPRLEIVRLLREHPQCVNAIATRLAMTQPAISQHLQLLREVGLVRAEKRGTWTHYAILPDALEQYGKGMAQVFGGWVELPKPLDGKSGCPSELLGECQEAPPRKAGKKGRNNAA